MKSILKKTFVHVALVTIGTLFVACGNDNEPEEPTPSPQPVKVAEAMTGEATNISCFWATVSGEVNLDSNDKFQVWIEYCKDEKFDIGNRQLQSIKDIDHVFSVELSNLEPGTTYYYRTFVQVMIQNYWSKYYGEIKTFTTPQFSLQESGAVDLGLSVKWAACNLGANKPEQSGGYFEWGETTEKETMTFQRDEETHMFPYLGNEISGTNYDAARAQLGGAWRMPTMQELSELVENCRSKWFTYKDVNGYLFIGTNNNYIFLPAGGEIGSNGTLSGNGESGRYWAGTLDPNSSTRLNTGSLYICKNYASAGFNGFRFDRLTIRPVTN